LGLALFLTHLFPFALFGIGIIAIFPWSKPRAWLRSGLPLAPVLALLALWMASSETASRSMDSLRTQSSPPAPIDSSIKEITRWSINVFQDTSDELWFLALVFLATI